MSPIPVEKDSARVHVIDSLKATSIPFLCILLVLSNTPTSLPQVEEVAFPDLGIEISSSFKQLVVAHQAEIENFILETKLIIAQTQEERLRIIEEETERLRTKVQEMQAEREQLVQQLQNGEIDNATFVAEMRLLAADIAAAAKEMGTLGKRLGELGQELAENLRARALALVESNTGLAVQLSDLGRSIAERVRERVPPVRPGSPPRGDSNNAAPPPTDGESNGKQQGEAGEHGENGTPSSPPSPPIPVPPVRPGPPSKIPGPPGRT